MPRLCDTRTNEEKKAEFIAAVEKRYTKKVAAKEVGISDKTVDKWAAQDPEFKQAIDNAQKGAEETLESSAYERAMKGDTTLTIFLLKGMRPEKYRDYFKADVSASGEFRIRFVPDTEAK